MFTLLFLFNSFAKADPKAAELNIEQTSQTEQVGEASDTPTTTVGPGMIVIGEIEVQRQRKALEDALSSQGYRKGFRRGNKMIYRPETVWRPTVELYDSGMVLVKRTPPRFEPYIPGRKDNYWRYLACIPPFGLMCIKANGWLIDKRRFQGAKTKVIDTNITAIQRWQNAVSAVAFDDRISNTLPEELETIWRDSTAVSDKHAQLLELWRNRTCTPEGEMAAAIISDFINYEVQASAQPISQEVLVDAEKNHPCQRKIVQ